MLKMISLNLMKVYWSNVLVYVNYFKKRLKQITVLFREKCLKDMNGYFCGQFYFLGVVMVYFLLCLSLRLFQCCPSPSW